jgi:hypothetical protein
MSVAPTEPLENVVATIAGWKPSSITEMLETYGHADVGSLKRG